MRVAVLAAGGRGLRLGRAGGKQLLPVAGRPLAAYALLALVRSEVVDSVVVVAHPDDREVMRTEVVDPYGGGRVSALVAGGVTRRDSVAAGIAAVPEDASTILVHDGARPLVTPELVSEAVRAREDRGLAGLVVGHPAVDTIKVVDEGGLVRDTPDRTRLWAAHTPQVFDAEALRGAYGVAVRDDVSATDDAELVARLGHEVGMLEGPRDNLKVTVPEDVALAEALLARGR